MRAPVTVLGACVLYPAALRDLMMRMTLAGLIDARWTSAILPDPDDRHVVAAAIEAEADWIVTWNLRDFPQSTLRTYGLSAITPDLLLLQLLEKRESETRRVLKETRLSLKNPEKSVAEYLATLRQQGLVGFCEAAGARTEEL